jgi:4-hydroxy-tetrahydrodipicolinate synthase
VSGLFVLGSTSEVAYLPDGHRRVVLDLDADEIAHVGKYLVAAGLL